MKTIYKNKNKFSLITLFILLIVIIISFTGCSTKQFSVPEMNGTYVNDYTSTLSTETIKKIETMGSSLEKETGIQMVVVIVNNLYGKEIQEAAIEFGSKWGIGQKDFDNGILFLINIDPKLSKDNLFIATGSGVEGLLVDSRVGKFLDDYAVEHRNNKEWNLCALETYEAIVSFSSEHYQEYQSGVFTDTEINAINAEKTRNIIIIAIIVFAIILLLTFLDIKFDIGICYAISSSGSGEGSSFGGGGSFSGGGAGR